MEQLFVLLNAIARMSPELEAHLRRILQCKKFAKGEFIVREGQVSNFIYFVQSGLVRIYNYNLQSNAEVTSWFLREGNVFMSVLSFFLQQASYENVVALEDCICWGISFEQLEEILRLFPEFEKHHGRILRQYYCRALERQFKLDRQSPVQRYTVLVEEEPELLRRVPVKLLQTYLQMSDSTFKRARRDYYSMKRGEK